MLTITEHSRGWHVPQIICDGCKQPITNYSAAMVVYALAEDEDGLSEVYHSHKDEACQYSVRQAAGHHRWSGPWDELADHLVLLAVHAGLLPGDFTQRYEYLLEREMIPEPSACDGSVFSA